MDKKNIENEGKKRIIRGISRAILIGTLLTGPCITARASEKAPEEQTYDLTEEKGKENLEKYFSIEEDKEKLNDYYKDFSEDIDIYSIYSQRIGYYEGSYKENLCYGEKKGERQVKINYNYSKDKNDKAFKSASNILGGISISSNIDAAKLVVKYNQTNIPDDIKQKLNNANNENYGAILDNYLIKNDVNFYVPIQEAEDIYVNVINEHKNNVIKTACEYNVELSEAQIIALTDFSFMYGNSNLKGLFEHIEKEGELYNFKTAKGTFPFAKNMENVTSYDELNNSRIRNAYRRTIIENCGKDDNPKNSDILLKYVTDKDAEDNIFLYNINSNTQGKITDQNWFDLNSAIQDEISNYEDWMEYIYPQIDIKNNEKFIEPESKSTNIQIEEQEQLEQSEETNGKEEITEEKSLLPISTKKQSKLLNLFKLLTTSSFAVANFFKNLRSSRRRAKRNQDKNSNRKNKTINKNETFRNQEIDEKYKSRQFKESIEYNKIDHIKAYRAANQGTKEKDEKYI